MRLDKKKHNANHNGLLLRNYLFGQSRMSDHSIRPRRKMFPAVAMESAFYEIIKRHQRAWSQRAITQCATAIFA